ncbi:MAG: N-acetylmuramidase, partial [Devosia sp.]
ADGVIGQMTLAAVAADLDNDALIGRIIDRREAFLRSLTTFATFGKGWLSRTSKLKVTAQAWASGRSAPPLAPKAVDAQPKARIEDAKTAPPKGLADAATGGGVTSGGLAVTLNGLKDQLSPYSTMFDWAGKIVVALLIISAVLTIGGLAYRFWATRKKAKLANALNTSPAGAQP